MFAHKVLYNKDLFTHILGYLDNNQTKAVINSFRGLLHYEYLKPTTQILLYGQVQSGKTSKIMDFITKFKTDKIKILIIQNNTLMLEQYVKTLSQRGITYKIIESKFKIYYYNKEQVLITINNKYRLNTLNAFIINNKIFNYSLILDESDQYLNRIQTHPVFKMSKDTLHVTATPFIYGKKFEIDNIVKIKPKFNYIGMNQIKINTIKLNIANPNAMTISQIKSNIQMKIIDIVQQDFLTVKQGLMLINCFVKVSDMKHLASKLTVQYKKIPIIVFSTKTYMYLNGVLKDITKVTNIQRFTDEFANISHAIFIAGRLSNRGINYTNTTYSRCITHQISLGKGDYTNFIQKCRIFGNRSDSDSNSIRPTLYCMMIYKKQNNFVENLMKRFNSLENVQNQTQNQTKTLKQLKILCKENNIKKYSKLRKNEIIELLEMNNIDY
jgi:hypothetical protein